MSASAGWYADPQDSQLLRYFDGDSWTTHTQPAPGAQPATPQAAAPRQPSAAQQAPAPPASPQAPHAPNQWSPQAQQPGHQAQPGHEAQEQPGYHAQTGRPSQPQGQLRQGQFQQGQFQQGQFQQGQFQQGQFQQGQFQQRQQGFQQTPSPLANQFTAQPRKPAWGTGASADGAPTGTPTAVKLWIVGALAAIAVFMGIGLTLAGDREPEPGDLSDALSDALGRKTFDCAALGEEAIALSEGDAPEEQLVSVSDLTMTRDKRSTVELPESGDVTALSCSGDGTWGDGTAGALVLELVLDADGNASVSYLFG